MDFVEERLDVGYDYGVSGGPTFNTKITVFGSGDEQRVAQWANALGRWDLGERNVTDEKLDYLLSFFRARRGREVGFRFKDWQDYRATDEALSPDGSPTIQLTKTYASQLGDVEVRDIRKPVGGTVSMKRGGSSYSFASLDTTTGIATLAKDKDLAISDVTAASPAEVTTSSNHGLSGGDYVWITGTGLSEIDDQVWQVTVVDTDTVTLDGSDTSGTGGSSSGSLEKYVQPGESLTWSGEFDVAARFDSDQFPATFEAADNFGPRVYFMSSLPIREIPV